MQLLYDLNGTLVRKLSLAVNAPPRWDYQWDVENRLTYASSNEVVIAQYTYDALGRRATKTAGGVTTQYTCDGMDILRETRPSETLTFIHGPRVDEPLAAEHGNGSLTYYHADALGSVVKTTDGAGAVTASYSYDSFGNLQTPHPGGYAFTGREWDPETGLYYYRARYYDPKIGRFMSEDPVGFAGGDFNLYAYVWNSVAPFNDPEGTNGRRAGQAAKKMVGNVDYQFDDPHPEIRGTINSFIGGRASPKCNAFVWDMLLAGGDPPGRLTGGRIPVAKEWADPSISIPGYHILPGNIAPRKGDVVSDGHHVGIYVKLPDGSDGTISASSDAQRVVHNPWGFRQGQAVVIRRCDCDGP